MDNTLSDDYIEWANHPFAYSLSAGCITEPLAPSSSLIAMPSSDLFNDEYMQYLHQPSSDPVALQHPPYLHHQQQQQPSPVEEDDNDSLDFSITTPNPFYFPAFMDPPKEHHVPTSLYPYNTLTPSTSTKSSASSSSSSTSLSSCTDWSTNFSGDPLSSTSAIPRSYVSLSVKYPPPENVKSACQSTKNRFSQIGCQCIRCQGRFYQALGFHSFIYVHTEQPGVLSNRNILISFLVRFSSVISDIFPSSFPTVIFLPPLLIDIPLHIPFFH